MRWTTWRSGAAWLLAVVLWLAPVPGAAAQEDAVSVLNPLDAGKTLVVATHEAPPFSFKDPQGRWSGISVRLWTDVARSLNLSFMWREYADVADMMRAMESGEADVGVAAVTVTNERERVMDFSHPYFHTGLGIAAQTDTARSVFESLVREFESPLFLTYLGALVVLLVLVGGAVWLLERKKNVEHFSSGRRGIGTGLWWAAVTMTTVGYGDIAPKTFWGRFLALCWMLVSVILVSLFTAGVAANLTANKIGSRVKGLRDLPHVLVGGVDKSAGVSYLKSQLYVNPRLYETVREALDHLNADDLDAVVYDRPILQYYINRDYKGDLIILKSVMDQQSYAFAFKAGSPLRKPVNIELLQRIADVDYWDDLVKPYLGHEPE